MAKYIPHRVLDQRGPLGRLRPGLDWALPRVGPTPRTKWVVNKLPAVRGYLGLRDRITMLAKAANVELLETTHTPIAGLAFDVELTASALRRIKQVVAQPKGGELLLVRRLCLVALAPAVGLCPRLGLPGNFGAKRRTKRTCLIQRLPPLAHDTTQAGHDASVQYLIPTDKVM